ncbi:glycosyltransferase family 2 protein [Lachnospiraceae bacterium CLA-AA-H215]|uniref:Glycosyltransferase family 2 protein n=1 Tax=Hominifimenecus microfluidus TaxID=2885348 RepID=A0AAE3E8L6_9FIRM|nr:glycosyltransferase family 2 protein [Hominifimenecus microfluidus]MCC2230025.1 glycosyltransferase family 2 protein [Hominifimenecus microfluidus]
MKLLTIAIPCYNSESYMEKCIESLLPGGSRVEILLVNDGSKDRTAEIADSYAARYPGIVRAIHQENKGHGGAVNTGIANADGFYFKVVDSDDWVDRDAYLTILDTLENLAREGQGVDMMISNFVYDKVGASHKKVMNYRHMLPTGQIFHWEDARHLWKGHYILMHSVIYRTRMLRNCGLKLPEHTFYVDNQFVYQPIPWVKNMYYLDVDFYHYFIGRDDQSVNEKNMIARIDQQLAVNYLMIRDYDLYRVPGRNRRHYMYNYLEIMMTISSIFLIRTDSPEADEKKKALWAYLKKQNPRLYRRMRMGVLGISLNLPGKIGKKIASAGYQISQMIYGFN